MELIYQDQDTHPAKYFECMYVETKKSGRIHIRYDHDPDGPEYCSYKVISVNNSGYVHECKICADELQAIIGVKEAIWKSRGDLAHTNDVPPTQTPYEKECAMTHHKMPLDVKLDEILKQIEAGANNLKSFGDFKAKNPLERSLHDTMMHHISCTLIDGAKLAEALKGGSDD